MTNYPQPTSLILIALMNNPRDLEIARTLGWYRIPLHSAPKIISVDYLAFYQTKAFREHKWQIRYIAPVKGHELTTRLELLQSETEHPHSNQEYYKIQLGPLIELKKPIPADKWRRITFLYTTGEHINRANSISDLVLNSEERPLFWQSLRERADQDKTYSRAAEDIDPEILAHLLGMIETDLR